MKKLLTICLIMATVFTANAQETKKYYIVFETQHATARSYANNEDNWKPEGFTFKPVKEYTATEYNKKMYTFITGKEWGKW